MAVFVYKWSKRVSKLVIDMVKELEIFIASIFLFLGVLGIFNARWIVRNKFESEKENRAVSIFKVVSFLLCIASLLYIYFKR